GLFLLDVPDGGISIGLAILVPVGIELVGQCPVAYLIGYPGQIGLQGVLSRLRRLILAEPALVCVKESAQDGQQDERDDVPGFSEIYVHGVLFLLFMMVRCIRSTRPSASVSRMLSVASSVSLAIMYAMVSCRAATSRNAP